MMFWFQSKLSLRWSQRAFLIALAILAAGANPAHSSVPDTVVFKLEYSETIRPPVSYIPWKRLRRPKIGLALSGGGSRGLAQIGVLEELEAQGIPIDFIAGSSMGSIVGGLYASGYSPQEIWDGAAEIDWDKIMEDTPKRSTLFQSQKEERDRFFFNIRFSGLTPYIPSSFSPGQKLTRILTDLTMRANYRASGDFDLLRVPFRAVATDLITGRRVVLRDGELAEAMRASVSVPLLFQPVERNGMLLVDGGLVDNIPVSVVREAGVDIVIAVDTSSELRSRSELNRPWELADQVTGIMQRERNREQLEAADFVIQVRATGHLPTDFSDVSFLRELGRTEAAKVTHQLEEMLRARGSTNGHAAPAYRIKGLSMELGEGEHPTEQIQHLSRSGVVHPDEIYAAMAELYNCGCFQDVTLTLVGPGPEGYHGRLQATPNPVLNSISFRGNTAISNSVLMSCVESARGMPISFQEGRRDLERILQRYRSAGYSLAAVKAIDYDRKEGRLRITIDEGEIGSIRFEGNRRTKDYVIQREFPLRVGDKFNQKAARRGLTNIHSTGLFDLVSLNIKKSDSLAALSLKLQEKHFQVLRTSWRYDLERLGKGFIEFGDENVLGTGAKLMALGLYGSRDRRLELSMRTHRILKSYLTASANAFYNREENITYAEGRERWRYRESRRGVTLSAGQNIKRLGAMSLGLALERIRFSPVTGHVGPVGRADQKTLSIRSVVDTRDRLPFPNSGKYYVVQYQTAGRYLDSDISYFKFYSTFMSYERITSTQVLMGRVAWGTSDLSTPFFEQFELGGEDSFFGLRDRELLGRQLFLVNIGYRARLPERVLPVESYIFIRYDTGGTWESSKEIGTKEYLSAVGGGLALKTLLGKVSLSYGRMNEGRSRVYFSAGFQF